jgi:hypothetical protein
MHLRHVNYICFLTDANDIVSFSLSAGATQYLLVVAALYGIGACLYAGK